MNIHEKYEDLLGEYGRLVRWSTLHLLNLSDELRASKKKIAELELEIRLIKSDDHYR